VLKFPALYCGCNSDSFASFIQNHAPAAAAIQATSSGEVPIAVALRESLITLNLIDGFGKK
jgi:hypothetical protein